MPWFSATGIHPVVAMWSIGNEIPERGEPLGAQGSEDAGGLPALARTGRARLLPQ